MEKAILIVSFITCISSQIIMNFETVLNSDYIENDEEMVQMYLRYQADEGIVIDNDDPTIYAAGLPIKTKYYHRLTVWVENK
jgi:hypothetical protein